LTFLVLAAAAAFAWFQVREARRLRKEQARPFVLIDFDAWGTIVELRITNIGKTIARDIRFKFDPSLTSTHDALGDPRGRVGDLSLFKDGIPSLAPGKEIKIFFDHFPGRLEAKLALTYHVTVSYVGHDRRALLRADGPRSCRVRRHWRRHALRAARHLQAGQGNRRQREAMDGLLGSEGLDATGYQGTQR
jgi:hypothetical protein